MDAFNYKDTMDQFYALISDFVSRHEEILSELMEKERLFATLRMDERDKKKIFFDWFIFDCKSSVYSKNLLSHFLDTEPLAAEAKEIFRGFLDNVYSIFEIKALRMGKEMIIRDLLSDKEYNVKETTLSRNVQKGQAVLMRVLPFHGYHILTGIGHVFPADASPLLKLSLQGKRRPGKKQNLNPLDVCGLFFAQEERERLTVPEKFRLLCLEGGIESVRVEEVIRLIKERALNTKEKYNDDLLKGIVSELKTCSASGLKELSRAFMDLWNHFIAEGNPAAHKGPVEVAVIHAGMNYLQSKVNPAKYKDIKKAEAKAKDVIDQWLNTPKEELGGKTPVEVIRDERRELGNPRMDVGFDISLSPLEVNPDLEKQAEALFFQGIEYVQQNKPAEALEAYEKHCRLHPDNPVVWQNMGVAHILLLDKAKAQECFERALELNPDYELARKNLKILKSATREDIERMAKEHRVQCLNRGKVV